MCGRFTLRTSARAVAQQFGLLGVEPFVARFNIAPAQWVPVVRPVLRPPSPETAVGRELVWLRWGLVPGWAKDPAIGNRLVNARAETASRLPAFREAMRRRRCLVVADGFYEWQRAGRKKQPYFIRLRDDRPLAFAALWEAWEGPDHVTLETCVLLTTDANGLLRPIHDRMPVILPEDAYAAWLDPAVEDPRQVEPLLTPYPSDQMAAHVVGSLVNDPSHESPRCIEPGEKTLF
ncbi:MAG: SOS response-associated peptidase [Thermoguttaceae bacterium]